MVGFREREGESNACMERLDERETEIRGGAKRKQIGCVNLVG